MVLPASLLMSLALSRRIEVLVRSFLLNDRLLSRWDRIILFVVKDLLSCFLLIVNWAFRLPICKELMGYILRIMREHKHAVHTSCMYLTSVTLLNIIDLGVVQVGSFNTIGLPFVHHITLCLTHSCIDMANYRWEFQDLLRRW